MPAIAGLLILAALWRLVIAPGLDPNHLRLPPQQHVHTHMPFLGVHTRLTDEVEQSKIERSLRMVRELGARWDVEYFPWNYIQGRGPHSWDWSHTDLVVNHAQRQGLRLIARLDSVPNWARPAGSDASYLDSEHYAAFGNFVYEFAKRYRGKVSAYVIWNEPNLAYEWGFRPPNPAAYTELLRVAYHSVKEADPTALVLAAPLAPTLENDSLAMDDLRYLGQLYDDGAARYFDGLAAHTYGWRNPPSQLANPGAINFQRVKLLRQ
ncbi:MAG: hypothetical protein ACYDAG_16980, partial [Chloroflexota bacterium]